MSGNRVRDPWKQPLTWNAEISQRYGIHHDYRGLVRAVGKDRENPELAGRKEPQPVPAAIRTPGSFQRDIVKLGLPVVCQRGRGARARPAGPAKEFAALGGPEGRNTDTARV
ncbi:hypothetical protein C0Q70_19173 [Pomacea canaliculata]|uniref:Uncharacterized protein n=1 Tax=Pomacea canaliculata TaxID=400727 RepID=A0A2T7NIK5_POMCA|nr:hypothetical protein C0Q70_19173 [Pomacea canaliculata]